MRALYVATDLRDADVLQQEVRRAAPKLTFDVCSGTAEARTRTEGTLNYDVMILDSSLPEHEQQQLIEHVRSRQIPLPIVILVGQGVTPSSSIVAAADECISRGPRLAERLAPGLRMAMERYRVVATVSRENERLKRSEARLRLIIEAMPAGVVLVDQAGKIQAMNLAGAALVGVAGPSDVVGRELYSLADQDSIQPLRDLVTRAFDGERGRVGFTCHGPDGLLRPLQIEALCIQKDAQGQGSVLGVLAASTGEVTPMSPVLEPTEESNVEFAFANDQHSDERMALEQALEEMRAEAARLSAEAESERSRVQQVLEELERSRATVAEHHAQKNQIEDRHRAAEVRVAELEARIGDLDARRREDEGMTSTLAARLEQLTGEAGEWRGEREKLQRERETLQGERETLQGERDTLQTELEGLRGELSAQARAQANAMVRAEAAEQEKARHAEAAASTQSTADARTRELAAELKAAQVKAEANEKALKAEVEKIRADAVRVAEALEAQGKDRKGAEAALGGVRDALQARVQDLEAQSADLEARRQAAVARVAELEEQRRAEQAALVSANTHEAELEQELKAAREEGARAGSERDALRSELGHVHESHRAAEDDASLKASETARIQAELDGRIQQLQAELESVLTERQAAQGALDATKAQADGSRGEIDQLRAELDQLRPELDQHRAVISERGAELEQRQTELAHVRGEFDQLRGELDRVKGEFEQVRGELDRVRGESDQVRGELESTRGARDASGREVEAVKAAVAKAAAVIAELRQGRDAVDARATAASGELDALRREVAASHHHATDLQQTLERERAEARERATGAERDHQDTLARLHKQIEEAREFHAAAAASRGPVDRGRRRQGERLGQLASAMANDLHGIVNVMADEARKLLGDLPEGSDVRAQAEQSLQSANRAGQLVRHLMRLSEREARASSGSEPNSVVRANEPMLRQLAGPDIDLRFELAPSLPPVECDADELAGLLSTLMVTVRGALPLGGSIRLTTVPPRKDGGRRRNDASLALAVVAEGYGMVSVPTTVCDEVVTRSGGTFSAQVDLKAGTTTFTAYMPIDQAADAGVTNIA
ncbi:MAG: PAS domain S-box protein [Vicinamibacteraceae bacterium]